MFLMLFRPGGTCEISLFSLHYSLRDKHWAYSFSALPLRQGYLALGSQTPRGPVGEIQGVYGAEWGKLPLYFHYYLTEIQYFLFIANTTNRYHDVFIPCFNCCRYIEIIYVHHQFKIMVVIRTASRPCYCVHKETYIPVLLYHQFVFKIF